MSTVITVDKKKEVITAAFQKALLQERSVKKPWLNSGESPVPLVGSLGSLGNSWGEYSYDCLKLKKLQTVSTDDF